MVRISQQVLGVKVGYVYASWTVIGQPFSRGSNGRKGGVSWSVVAQCGCGRIDVIPVKNIVRQRTQQCRSCQTSQRNTKHSGCHTKLYVCWKNMRLRCQNPNDDSFHRYGGRGITICKEWNDFATFRAWAGQSGYQEQLTLERLDVNGNYGPKNCTWANRTVQARNRRTNKFLTFNGETKCVAEWAEQFGIRQGTLSFRIRAGWNVGKALATPVRQ